MHLLLVVRSGIDSYILQHWIFDGQSWTAESSNSFQFTPESEVSSITSDISKNGILAVTLLNSNLAMQSFDQYQLFYTDLAMEVPALTTSEITPTPDVIPTPIPTIQNTEPFQPQITSTPTPVTFPLDNDNPGNSDWIFVAGPVLVGLIILVVIFLIVRWVRN